MILPTEESLRDSATAAIASERLWHSSNQDADEKQPGCEGSCIFKQEVAWRLLASASWMDEE